MAGRKPTAGAVVQALGIGIGLVAMVGGFVLLALQYRPYAVPTGSMEPTVMAGQTVLAEKVSGSEVGRGDVVVFKDTDWGNTAMVKRVIGVGGDTVKCCDTQGRVTVNGVPLDETYLDENPTIGRAGPADQQFSATVPAGRLWLMGDNRSISEDSRVHIDQLGGTVPASAVVGRVEGVVFPVGSMHTIDRTAVFDTLPGGHAATDHGPLGLAAYAAVGGGALVLITAGAGTVAGIVTRRRTREA
ncbi:signal peptidase I [Streptacidiphilus jiangxiensis]|uniref:Signal peptidase I n=1 Tax=Streptacidiphilus jiangxiensis TaxID=235985 RepID=A0A1H7XUU7_STRJI|nr:signal peptidase I [Streptacidiphilus jiangxiensis]SEM37712.1 signal peptidase I [Streptacidiphilus jiangxiensis]